MDVSKKRRRDPQKTKKDIPQCAVIEFAEKGFHGSSVCGYERGATRNGSFVG